MSSDQAINSASSTDIFSSAFMIPNVGAPFIIGMAVGYFAKKMLKVALFMGGAVVVLLFASEYYGIASVSEAHLQGAASTATEVARQSGNFLIDRLSNITSKGVSGTAGFYVGLKMG